MSGARAGLAQANEERNDLSLKLKWTQNRLSAETGELQQRLERSAQEQARAAAKANEVRSVMPFPFERIIEKKNRRKNSNWENLQKHNERKSSPSKEKE